MELINLHGYQVLELLNQKKVSVLEYVNELINHIKIREPEVGAWTYFDEENIILSAKKIDEKRFSNSHLTHAGLPIGIKDIIDTKDMPTENGSKTCLNRCPSKDAHLVKLLRNSDILIFGKCVTTEFALSAPGKTKNPNDLRCTPGGSSSGSAAAVADKMIPTSIGSQTGGSVLRPASFNGIIGFKPTFGSISRSGMSPISSQLDHPGIYARSIKDVELISRLIISFDEKDFDSIQNCSFNNKFIKKDNYNFAFVKGPAWYKGEKDMKDCLERFVEKSSLNITEINLPSIFDTAVECHEIIMNAGIHSSFRDVYSKNKSKLHPYTVNRIEKGLTLNAADYVDSIEKAKKMKFELEKIFLKYDAIITSSAPGEAPRDLSTTGNAIFNGYWTMMGVPSISLPLLKGDNGLPIGVQVISSWTEDQKLLDISSKIMEASS